MNDGRELIDLETYVQLRRAAPQVTQAPRDVARLIVNAIVEYSDNNSAHEDSNGNMYWQAAIKELLSYPFMKIVTPKMLGRICGIMELVKWRRKDGYHVAWSHLQLEILKNYFE